MCVSRIFICATQTRIIIYWLAIERIPWLTNNPQIYLLDAIFFFFRFFIYCCTNSLLCFIARRSDRFLAAWNPLIKHKLKAIFHNWVGLLLFGHRFRRRENDASEMKLAVGQIVILVAHFFRLFRYEMDISFASINIAIAEPLIGPSEWKSWYWASERASERERKRCGKSDCIRYADEVVDLTLIPHGICEKNDCFVVWIENNKK